MANINQPIYATWDKDRVKKNYLKEALIENGYWDRYDDKQKEIINKLQKI